MIVPDNWQGYTNMLKKWFIQRSILIYQLIWINNRYEKEYKIDHSSGQTIQAWATWFV